MKSFEKVILETAAAGEAVLVFPSEVAAHFWQRRVLEAGGPEAIEVDRFISWDSFKEHLTPAEHTARPANRAFRLFFAADFLQKAAEGRVSVESLLPQAFAWNAPSFTSWLSTLLPGLRMTRRAAEAVGVDLGRVYDDLVTLEESYRQFLKAGGFFEPSWQDPCLREDGASYLICFPEVIEDYSDYASSLAEPPFRTVTAAKEESRAEVLRFETTLEEMDWVLRKIAGYLDGGMNPRDIVITLSDSEEWRYLEEEARLYGIPLDIRMGKELTSYRPAVFFSLLSEALSGSLELEALEGLFLDRAYPWKNRDAGPALVRFGREHSVLKNYGDVNLWKDKLTATGLTGLWNYLEALQRGVRSLSGAETFASLRTRIYGFIDRFLDADLWSEEHRQVFRYTLDSLGDLVKTEGLLAARPEVKPFRLYLAYLSGRVYVPRGAGAGVRVFPYGVTAGIMPPVHFVVGANQGRIRHISSVPAFLREDQRIACSLSDRDFTDAFLSLYMASGMDVYVSSSARGFEGPGLTPSLLLDRGGPGFNVSGKSFRAAEEAYWAGDEDLPTRFSRCFVEGFERIAVAFHPAASSFSFQEVPDLAADLLTEVTDENGRIVLSPTAMDSFTGCRFQYLLTYLLRVEDNIPGPQYPDRMERGTFFHQVLCFFMEHLRTEGKGFQPGRIDEYRKFMTQVIRRTADQWEKEGRAFIDPVWRALLRETEEFCAAFLETEEKEFPSYEPLWLEKKLRLPLADKAVLLKGFVDRLSVCGDDTVLIDYKTKVRSVKADFPVEGEPTSIQLPAYAYLAGQEGRQPVRALYYDITKGTYTRVLDPLNKGWVDPDTFARWTAGVPFRAAEMADTLRRGDYSFPEEGTCQGCDYRMVCREKYVVRFDTGEEGGV
ncbi:MAG: PD-(D/E)XK nuclease family protein [Spirochaetales bacterium]|nr:PD-(D/E)XK nuclease family protein [Spirochaetales bacterium]